MSKTTIQGFNFTNQGLERWTFIREYIGHETTAVQHLINRAPTVLPSFMAGKHMAVSQEAISLAQEVRSLNIHTYFRPMTDVDEKVILVPVFLPHAAAEMKLSWPVPTSMFRVYFVGAWLLSGGLLLVGQMPNFYLIAVSGKYTYLLPLPNIHDEGRICMGDDIKALNLKKDLPEQFDQALGIFNNSKWNADLLDADVQRWSKRMFRFDPKEKPLPVDGKWEEMVTRVNSTAYAFLVKLPPPLS